MSQEELSTLCETDLPVLPPPNPPQLSRSFSTYNDYDAKETEHWLYQGGPQPSDEVIQHGFPILYNQVYFIDLHGQPRWINSFHFTDERKQRWEIMESISGLKPIMNDYQPMYEEHRASAAAYKEQCNEK